MSIHNRLSSALFYTLYNFRIHVYELCRFVLKLFRFTRNTLSNFFASLYIYIYIYLLPLFNTNFGVFYCKLIKYPIVMISLGKSTARLYGAQSTFQASKLSREPSVLVSTFLRSHVIYLYICVYVL